MKPVLAFPVSDAFRKHQTIWCNKATYLLCGRPDDLDKMKNTLKKRINSPQIKMDRFEGLK